MSVLSEIKWFLKAGLWSIGALLTGTAVVAAYVVIMVYSFKLGAHLLG
jgi:hypothetical protein